MLKQIILQTSPIPSMQDQIHEMIQRKKPIYIFGGLGDMSLGSINAKYLENQGIVIDGFIANQAFIKTSTYMDKPVFAIEDYFIPRDVSIIIGISKWKIAYQELQKFNFQNIFLFDSFSESVLDQISLEYFLGNYNDFIQTYNMLEDVESKESMSAYLQGKIFNNYEALANTYEKFYQGGGG